MIMQLLQHNQQEYNRYYRRLLCVNLCRTIISQSNSMQPHQQNTGKYSLGGADGNRTHVLKVTELQSHPLT